jgi:hypothetical protein
MVNRSSQRPQDRDSMPIGSVFLTILNRRRSSRAGPVITFISHWALVIGHWLLVIGAARGRLRMARAPVGSGDEFAKDLYEFLAFLNAKMLNA